MTIYFRFIIRLSNRPKSIFDNLCFIFSFIRVYPIFSSFHCRMIFILIHNFLNYLLMQTLFRGVWFLFHLQHIKCILSSSSFYSYSIWMHKVSFTFGRTGVSCAIIVIHMALFMIGQKSLISIYIRDTRFHLFFRDVHVVKHDLFLFSGRRSIVKYIFKPLLMILFDFIMIQRYVIIFISFS